MKRFLADKSLIPDENLIKIKYEDLEINPMEQWRRAYEGLNIAGFSELEAAMQAYLVAIKGYQKNKYEIDANVISKVNQHWQFVFDEGGTIVLKPRNKE